MVMIITRGVRLRRSRRRRGSGRFPQHSLKLSSPYITSLPPFFNQAVKVLIRVGGIHHRHMYFIHHSPSPSPPPQKCCKETYTTGFTLERNVTRQHMQAAHSQ